MGRERLRAGILEEAGRRELTPQAGLQAAGQLDGRQRIHAGCEEPLLRVDRMVGVEAQDAGDLGADVIDQQVLSLGRRGGLQLLEDGRGRCRDRFLARRCVGVDLLEKWPLRSGFEDRLDEDTKTRAWPTAGEIKAASLAITGPSSRRIAEGNEVSPLDVVARRMDANEAVSDGYLYRRLAVELLASGKVSEDQMSRYRTGLFVQLKDTYDEPIALAKLAELKARHAAAEAATREPIEPRVLPKPQPKMMTKNEWGGAA